MIDKKPFRVTNEQAKAVIACSDGGMECPSTCPNYGIDDCPIGNVADYMLASDLLDARELIDKQEAVIKEAVAIIDHARKYGIDNACSCDDCKKADSFLEKSKDYAL